MYAKKLKKKYKYNYNNTLYLCNNYKLIVYCYVLHSTLYEQVRIKTLILI